MQDGIGKIKVEVIEIEILSDIGYLNSNEEAVMRSGDTYEAVVNNDDGCVVILNDGGVIPYYLSGCQYKVIGIGESTPKIGSLEKEVERLELEVIELTEKNSELKNKPSNPAIMSIRDFLGQDVKTIEFK